MGQPFFTPIGNFASEDKEKSDPTSVKEVVKLKTSPRQQLFIQELPKIEVSNDEEKFNWDKNKKYQLGYKKSCFRGR